MDIKSVKQLAALAQEFDLAQLAVKDGEFEVTISRGGAAVVAAPMAATPAPVAVAAQPAQAQEAGFHGALVDADHMSFPLYCYAFFLNTSRAASSRLSAPRYPESP